MKNEQPLDRHQINAQLLAKQTGSRVHHPGGVDWQPPRSVRTRLAICTLQAIAVAVFAALAALVVVWLT